MEKAKVWTERVVIPTYDIGEAERLLSRCEDNYPFYTTTGPITPTLLGTTAG